MFLKGYSNADPKQTAKCYEPGQAMVMMHHDKDIFDYGGRMDDWSKTVLRRERILQAKCWWLR